MSYPLPFQVLPWNGHTGALSLTFDDGDPSQLDVAIPEMEKRNFQGTFYLISRRLTRPEEWKKAAAHGQEIGSHSQDHKHVRDLAPGEAERQVAGAKKELEDLLQAPVPTFAYPFTEIDPSLRRSAEAHHLLARGGMGEYYFTPDSDPDLAYLPSQVARSQTSPGVYKGWAEEALQRSSWTIAQFHAFEGTATGWQPMSRRNLVEFLDHLTGLKKDLWIAPLGKVGAYWLAQKRLEGCRATQKDGLTVFNWEVPGIPEGTHLELRVTQPKVRLLQNGIPLAGTSPDRFTLDFAKGNLAVEKH